jgi:plasmid stabilization system protein ParE
MASKSLRFHPQAEQEYLTALSWYRERSLTAAISLEGTFAQAVARIREAPHRWPIYFKDFRKYTLRQFPFSIVYQDFSSEIVVFAVAHGRRQPGYWRDRKR